MMAEPQPGLVMCPVYLPRQALRGMIGLVRALYRLSTLSGYRALVKKELPKSARFDPGHDAVMMGYDFHLTEEGPRLIEVNTNAGGGLLAYRTRDPEGPSLEADDYVPMVATKRGVLRPFAEEMRAFSGGQVAQPRRVAIVDERPREQFLYPEMQALADLFERWGAEAGIYDPSELEYREDGVYANGSYVEMIYNRFCDFYLETEAGAGLREAYLNGRVCLTPNPRAYGLLADKRRMIRWSDPDFLREAGLDEASVAVIGEVVLASRMLEEYSEESLWPNRKGFVLKPVSGFGSRGVLLGKSMSRKRFRDMPPEGTLVQEMAAPSLTVCDGEAKELKTDFRLFVYRDRVLGVAARLYKGQVTNFREAGSGYAPVKVV